MKPQMQINWRIIAVFGLTLIFDVLLVLYVLAPALDRLADWWVR